MTPSEVFPFFHLLSEDHSVAWSKAVKIQFMERQGCSHSLNRKTKKGEEEMTIRYSGNNSQAIHIRECVGGCMGIQCSRVKF